MLASLRPSLIREATSFGAEQRAASEDFLKYPDRQYGRFERVLRDLNEPSARGGFAVRDMGRSSQTREREHHLDYVCLGPDGPRPFERCWYAVSELAGLCSPGLG